MFDGIPVASRHAQHGHDLANGLVDKSFPRGAGAKPLEAAEIRGQMGAHRPNDEVGDVEVAFHGGRFFHLS